MRVAANQPDAEHVDVVKKKTIVVRHESVSFVRGRTEGDADAGSDSDDAGGGRG